MAGAVLRHLFAPSDTTRLHYTPRPFREDTTGVLRGD